MAMLDSLIRFQVMYVGRSVLVMYVGRSMLVMYGGRSVLMMYVGRSVCLLDFDKYYGRTGACVFGLVQESGNISASVSKARSQT